MGSAAFFVVILIYLSMKHTAGNIGLVVVHYLLTCSAGMAPSPTFTDHIQPTIVRNCATTPAG